MTSPREPTGAEASAPASAEPAADAADDQSAVDVSESAPAAPAAAPEAGASADEPSSSRKQRGTVEFTEGAAAATKRASRPLLVKRRVEITGLVSKPAFNGRTGVVMQLDRDSGRYAVELDAAPPDDKKGEKLKVKEANLKLLPEEEGGQVV